MKTSLIPSSFFRILFILATLFVAGIAHAQTDESAMRMVKELRLGQNLIGMSYKLSMLTAHYSDV
jgi:hypothetical protein